MGGRLFIDPNTNLISGIITEVVYVYDPDHKLNFPPATGVFEIPYNLRTFNPPHKLYPELPTITVTGNASLDFHGEGIGVTFGEPLEITLDTFKSGVDDYLPKQETARPEAMDTSGVVPSNDTT